MQRKLLKVPEIAQILGVSTQRAYELIRLGLLPSVRLGRQIRVDPIELEKFIVNGGKELSKNE